MGKTKLLNPTKENIEYIYKFSVEPDVFKTR